MRRLRTRSSNFGHKSAAILFAFAFAWVYNNNMYLLSLYFDEKTNQKICNLMKCVAERSGNTDMTDKAVPPHITLAVFESRESVEVLGRALVSLQF